MGRNENQRTNNAAMSSEHYLAKHVFNGEKNLATPVFRENCDLQLSTEDFLKYEVYRHPVPEHLHKYMANPPERVKRQSNKSVAPRMVLRQADQQLTGISPQAGPEGPRDFTPDNAPKIEQKQFLTIEGVPYGHMQLIRDVHGRIITRSITLFGGTTRYDYAYDIQGRLLAAKVNGTLTEQYAYGPNGERIQDLEGNRYIYDDMLRLIQIVGLQENTHFLYDDAGRMVEKHDAQGTTLYGYNQHNALTDVVLPSGDHVQYIIDPAGRRVAKRINGTVTEKYCWHDMVRLMGMCDGNDNHGVHFLYADDFGGAENWLPVAIRYGGQTFSMAFDQAGALLAIADNKGNAIQKIMHASFGGELAAVGQPFSLPTSFGGGLLDRDTGLIHLVYRDYNSATAHFIQPDPLGYKAGDIEIYGWCLDDPVNLVDPLGLEGKEVNSSDGGSKSSDGIGNPDDDSREKHTIFDYVIEYLTPPYFRKDKRAFRKGMDEIQRKAQGLGSGYTAVLNAHTELFPNHPIVEGAEIILGKDLDGDGHI